MMSDASHTHIHLGVKMDFGFLGVTHKQHDLGTCVPPLLFFPCDIDFAVTGVAFGIDFASLCSNVKPDLYGIHNQIETRMEMLMLRGDLWAYLKQVQPKDLLRQALVISSCVSA